MNIHCHPFKTNFDLVAHVFLLWQEGMELNSMRELGIDGMQTWTVERVFPLTCTPVAIEYSYCVTKGTVQGRAEPIPLWRGQFSSCGSNYFAAQLKQTAQFLHL